MFLEKLCMTTSQEIIYYKNPRYYPFLHYTISFFWPEPQSQFMQYSYIRIIILAEIIVLTTMQKFFDTKLVIIELILRLLVQKSAVSRKWT